MKFPILRRLVGAVGLLLSVCLAACTTEPALDPQPFSQTVGSLQVAPTVAQARRWYDSTYHAPAAVLPLDWSRAHALGDGVVTPFQEPTNLFARSPGQGYRYLLVTPGPVAGFTGTVVEVVLPDKSLPAEMAPTVAWEAYAQHRQQTAGPLRQVTGRVLFYSPTYHYLAGYAYTGGVAAAQPVRLALIPRAAPPTTQRNSQAAPKKPTGSAPPTTNIVACTPIITDWYDPDDWTYITTTYDYSNCEGDGGGAGWGGPGNGWGGDGPPPPPPTGGGGGTGGHAFNPANVYLFDGQKPLSEYNDKCSGLQGLWNLGVNNNNAETAGVITADGKFLVVAIVGAAGGAFGGLYHYDSGIGPGVDYYQWPVGQGAPSQTYQGMIQSNGHYFIPITATVHTHTPCLSDGTDGISNIVLSQGDRNLASNFSNITHYIVGCNALGTFSTASNSPSILTTGELSNTCSSL